MCKRTCCFWHSHKFTPWSQSGNQIPPPTPTFSLIIKSLPDRKHHGCILPSCHLEKREITKKKGCNQRNASTSCPILSFHSREGEKKPDLQDFLAPCWAVTEHALLSPDGTLFFRIRNDWSTKTEKQKKPKDNCKYTYALARIASMKATSNDPFWLPTFPTIIVSRGPSRTQMPAPRHIHLTCMLRMAEMIVFYRDTRTKLLEFLGSHTSPQSLGIMWTLFTLPTGSSRDSCKGPCWVPAESYRNVVNVVMLTIVSVLP